MSANKFEFEFELWSVDGNVLPKTLTTDDRGAGTFAGFGKEKFISGSGDGSVPEESREIEFKERNPPEKV